MKNLFWDVTGIRYKLEHVARTNNINPFLSNVPFLHPLKTSGSLWFSDVFRGYKNGTLGKNVLSLRYIHIFHTTDKSKENILQAEREALRVKKLLTDILIPRNNGRKIMKPIRITRSRSTRIRKGNQLSQFS